MSEKKEPLVIQETAGEKHYCTCKKTKNPPYCDGSHPGTGCEPHKIKIDTPQEVKICTCGMSTDYPMCDGTHYNC